MCTSKTKSPTAVAAGDSDVVTETVAELPLFMPVVRLLIVIGMIHQPMRAARNHGPVLILHRSPFTLIVFDALEVPHAAPTPIARAAVTSQVTVRAAAVVGIGAGNPLAHAVNEPPTITSPCPFHEPPDAPLATARRVPV